MRRLAALSLALCLLAVFCVGAFRLVNASVLEARRRRVVETAMGLRGARYGLGAEAPPAFDCSGFVRYVYSRSVDLDLPRNSREQVEAGSPVELGDARPGDLLAFGPRPGSPSHVGIYLGGGSMIHAASEGPVRGVVVTRLDEPWFRPRLLGVRSVLDPPGGAVAAPGTAASRPRPPAPLTITAQK
jgi:hypothetical protein